MYDINYDLKNQWWKSDIDTFTRYKHLYEKYEHLSTKTKQIIFSRLKEISERYPSAKLTLPEE